VIVISTVLHCLQSPWLNVLPFRLLGWDVQNLSAKVLRCQKLANIVATKRHCKLSQDITKRHEDSFAQILADTQLLQDFGVFPTFTLPCTLRLSRSLTVLSLYSLSHHVREQIVSLENLLSYLIKRRTCEYSTNWPPYRWMLNTRG
jgi:hypothetical protein